LNEHLTAMRYSDWALGEFFKKIQNTDFYKHTIFVIVGDHGFSTSKQVTDIDLLRFSIPLLIIAPGIVEQYGSTVATVGSQVDIAPTMAGLLGGDSAHSCWGRDLLNVKDAGFAMIKPSGSDQTTAFIEGDLVLVKQPRLTAKLYQYQSGNISTASLVSDNMKTKELELNLQAYIEVAMDSLLHGKAGYE